MPWDTFTHMQVTMPWALMHPILSQMPPLTPWVHIWLFLCIKQLSALSDYGFPRFSWSHVAIMITWWFPMQCHQRAQRSWPSNTDFWPWPLHAEIFPVFPKVLLCNFAMRNVYFFLISYYFSYKMGQIWVFKMFISVSSCSESQWGWNLSHLPQGKRRGTNFNSPRLKCNWEIKMMVYSQIQQHIPKVQFCYPFVLLLSWSLESK